MRFGLVIVAFVHWRKSRLARTRARGILLAMLDASATHSTGTHEGTIAAGKSYTVKELLFYDAFVKIALYEEG